MPSSPQRAVDLAELPGRLVLGVKCPYIDGRDWLRRLLRPLALPLALCGDRAEVSKDDADR